MKSLQFSDGLYTTKIVEQAHEGLTYVERTQDNEQAILRENAEMRKMESKDFSFGRQVASIPEIAYKKVLKQYPQLRNGNRHERHAALLKVLAEHPEWCVVPKNKIWAPSRGKDNGGKNVHREQQRSE